MGQKWTCPYCNRPCTVGDDDVRVMTAAIDINERYGMYWSETIVIVCPNPDCGRQKISLNIYEASRTVVDTTRGKQLYRWNVLPESEARPFPDYIPEQIRTDYEEACLIKNKSPKASATLSRRCLQGMIRDFWGVKKKSLYQEIAELEEKVDASTWKAIDSVRHVGNIGAHMEKDVNLLIDVDPDEAGLLIWLIETLFQEWYIAQHDREERMTAIAAVALAKNEAKKVVSLGESSNDGTQ